MAQVTIHITIPATVHRLLSDHLSKLMKPPRVDPDTGAIITERLFSADDPVADWVSDIVAANVGEIIRAQQSPPKEFLEAQLAAQVAAESLRKLYRPPVSSTVELGEPK